MEEFYFWSVLGPIFFPDKKNKTQQQQQQQQKQKAKSKQSRQSMYGYVHIHMQVCETKPFFPLSLTLETNSLTRGDVIKHKNVYTLRSKKLEHEVGKNWSMSIFQHC